MEDRLEKALNRVTDWLKYEDAKNVALVTLDGVGIGVIVQWLSNVSGVMSYLLGFSLLALLVSLLTALFSFFPLLADSTLHSFAAWWRQRRLTGQNPRPNVLFFADIAGTPHEDYLHWLRAAAGEQDDDKASADIPSDVTITSLELDYAREIVANANIAVMKVSVFKAAFAPAFVAFLAICVAAFAHSFLKLGKSC
jgi:hypothetical protein